MKRRHLLQGTAAALATPYLARAQSKPDKLVYVGDNGPWHFVLVEEVGLAFEKQTGIKIDYTLLPTDPWQARLKTELGGGSKDIDIVQWSVGMAGWIAPHMLDHEALAQEIVARDPSWDWNDFLPGSKRAATYEGHVSGIP
ncbi:MAG: extracellular solute-binding protein, partial [Rhodopila sp.]